MLTKTYHMLDDTEPVLEKAEGCSIDWKPGKNCTVKVRRALLMNNHQLPTAVCEYSSCGFGHRAASHTYRTGLRGCVLCRLMLCCVGLWL